MANKTNTPTPETGAATIPDPPFEDHVLVAADLDTKTYRLARQVGGDPGKRQALAERILTLATAPADLKEQATAVLQG
jgi:hypothetical protein